MALSRYQRYLFIWLFIASTIALIGFNPKDSFLIQNLPVAKNDSVFKPTYSAEQINQFGEFFDQLAKNQNLNGIVLLGQKGHIIYTKHYGLANKETGDSLNINSTFQLASVSKQFTAVSILQLYQKGLLKLTDTVANILPGFPYPDITIHQLLTHRSGLPNYHYLLPIILCLPITVIYNSV
jgi:CubicO group peptidase (beta-lactamase class C family)